MPDSKEPNLIENLDELSFETVAKKKIEIENKIIDLNKLFILNTESLGKTSQNEKVIERQEARIKSITAQIENYDAQLVAIKYKLSLPEKFKTFDELCEFLKADEPDARISSYKEALDLLNSIESSAQEFNLTRVLTKIEFQKEYLEKLLKIKK
jgi:hypothetical protein